MKRAAARSDATASRPVSGTLDELEAHLPYLFRYALAQLRDADAAQEVVQEALVSALKGKGGFEGRSAARSWLTAILKHKIIDFQRARSRERLTDDLDAVAADDDDAFDAQGSRVRPIADWGDPDRALENAEFWKVMQACLDDLPPRAAEIFMAREVMGESLEEVCNIHGITATNCAVALHRARLKLRDCLEAKWFA